MVIDMDKELFETWARKEGFSDSELTTALNQNGFEDGEYLTPSTRVSYLGFCNGYQAATSAAESERNNLLAVIAKQREALISCKSLAIDTHIFQLTSLHVDKALSLSPDNCKLVPKAWMAMSGSFEMIASTKDKLPDSVADAAIQLFTISTINDTISGRDGE
jgi:hypothetical protein